MSQLKKYAEIYHQLFGLNVLPVRGKKPTIIWDKWQSEKQTSDAVDKMDWSNCTGIGISMGVNDLRVLDLDSVDDVVILTKLLEDLGLPNKYPWVVQSGSGEGFHISVRVQESDFIKEKLGDKAVYKLDMIQEGYCDHLELRWKNCQTVFPPSNHASGGNYNFYYDEPKESPIYVDIEKLLLALGNYCLLSSEPKNASSCNNVKIVKDDKIFYNPERLENALSYLSEHLPAGSYEEWYKIGFALVPLDTAGEKYFIEMSLNNPNYRDTEENLKRKFDELAKEYDGRITLGTIFYLAESYGWKKPIIRFWSIDEVNGKVIINRTRFKRFLEGEGFYKYRIDSVNGSGSNYLFVRIENNIVEEINSIDIKDFVINYLEQIPIEEFNGTSRTDIIDAIIKSNNQLFTDQFLEFLITKIIEMSKDTKEKGYFYFQNGFVEIDKNEIKFNNYNKLKGYIWKKQIINRIYKQTQKRSMFEDLINNICKTDSTRYLALKSSIGYLLHTYKDPSIAKAIIFTDEKLSEGAYGRSGKGLVIKAIGHIRSIIVEDGRNFNPSKNFAFQRVKADTNIIAIEDISEKFPFERFFSIITDGIAVEKKNKDEFYLGFSESPKLVISTNFSIRGVDDSSMDRQFIIEFSDYYNMEHKPIDDFGKLFFINWYEEEWQEFDCFMIDCIQYYLKNGLVYYESVNIEKKKLIDETSIEFSEFCESLKINLQYDKKDLFESFNKEYSDYVKMPHQSTFTKWLKLYARIRDLEIIENKSGSIRTITFKNNEIAA